MQDADFLDLFAGTGAIGIEALSRGAAHVTFVESGRKAANVIRANLKTLAIEGESTIHERPVADALGVLARDGSKFDICFLDPPYALQGAYEQTFRLLANSELLSTRGVVVAEHDKRYDPGDGVGMLVRYRVLSQGDSSLSFYRREEPGTTD